MHLGTGSEKGQALGTGALRREQKGQEGPDLRWVPREGTADWAPLHITDRGLCSVPQPHDSPGSSILNLQRTVLTVPQVPFLIPQSSAAHLPSLSRLMTFLFSQQKPWSDHCLRPVGQALWLHCAAGLSCLSLPFPPHCHLLVPLICHAAALEWLSLHQTTLHLDH